VTSGPADATAARLRATQARIAAAAERAGRAPGEIALLGVAKQVAAEKIALAVAAGLAHVGENYLAEAKAKRPVLVALLAERGLPTPRWHFVGRLQRNKARAVAESFDCLHSLDREELCEALGRHSSAAGRTLDVLVQVNLAGEPQKGGCAPEAVGPLLRACRRWPSLRATGLMTIPPADADPEGARPHFRALRALRDELRTTPEGAGLHELSMGMSADFEVAIEEGATIIRVGTAIFGARGEIA
jgi:pyridoxal phosphate enzyme (YggS family)